jgi:hypothetical protein
MNISSWEYDFPSLPHWDEHEKSPDVTDALFESPDGSFCILNYSILESEAANNLGYAAVLKNKQSPELVFCAENLKFSDVNPFFAQASHTVALLAVVTEKSMNKDFDITLIIDLDKKRFAFAPFYASDERRLYPMTEEKGRLFLLIPDGTKRNVTKLKHYPLAKLNYFTKVKVTSNLLGHVLFEPSFNRP